MLSLLDEYDSRLINHLEIHEMEAKKSQSTDIKLAEAKLLLKGLDRDIYKIALDEHGELLDSHQLAELIQTKSTAGFSSFIFFIGGANGLHESVLHSADKIIALGRITLPHMLVRLVLVEQIYRIEKIVGNHPYDK